MNVFPITISPLHDRREDIPQLAEHCLDNFRKHQGKRLPGISQAALDQMLTYDRPGNVRELRNLIEYATIVTSGELIRPEHLGMRDSNSCQEESTKNRISLTFNFSPEDFSLDAVNRLVLNWALEQCNNKSSAARLMKDSLKLFY